MRRSKVNGPTRMAGVIGMMVLAACRSGALSEVTIAPRPALLGVEAIDEPLPILDSAGARSVFREPRDDDVFPPMRILLSRSRYWQQDGHMDVVVRLRPDEDLPIAHTRLLVRLLDASGRVVTDSLSPTRPTRPQSPQSVSMGCCL